MKSIRRLVTGHPASSKATVVSDTMVEGIELDLMPGAEFHALWGSDRAPYIATEGREPKHTAWSPAHGGFRFTLNTLPPDSAPQAQPADIEAAVEQAEAKMPAFIKARPLT